MGTAGTPGKVPSAWVTTHPGALGSTRHPPILLGKLLGGKKDVAGKTIPCKERDHLFPCTGRQRSTVQHSCTQGLLLTLALASKSPRLKPQKFWKSCVFSDVLNGQLRICFNGKQLHSSVIWYFLNFGEGGKLSEFSIVPLLKHLLLT